LKLTDFRMIKAQADAGDPLFPVSYTGALTERERHLIGLTVAVTKGCPECTARRLARADQAGIDEAVIVEAVNLAAGINSGFILMTAVKASDSLQTPS